MHAGHRALASSLIAQMESTTESTLLKVHMMNRMIRTLKEKIDILMKLHEEIIAAAVDEEEIKEEIEQADIYKWSWRSSLWK